MPDNRGSANGERVLADLNALRAFFGDLFSLLSGMKTSVPLSTTVSTDLADLIDLLLGFMGARRAPRACAPARRRDRG
jgi:hypothetical protein